MLEDLFDGDSDEDEESGDEDERGTAADFERVLTAGMERVLDGKMKAKKMKDVSVLASRCSRSRLIRAIVLSGPFLPSPLSPRSPHSAPLRHPQRRKKLSRRLVPYLSPSIS